ncbi:MAG: thioredoxin family protein [Planctomycetota bacterium]
MTRNCTLRAFVILCCSLATLGCQPQISNEPQAEDVPQAAAAGETIAFIPARSHFTKNKQSALKAKAELQIFSAVWCSVCRDIPPVIKNLNQDLPNLEVTELDLDVPENLDEWATLGGDAAPYMFLLIDDEVTLRIKGLLPYDQLKSRLEIELDANSAW